MTQPTDNRVPHSTDRQRSVKTVLDPQAMTLENAARVLSRIGGKTVTVDVLQADIDAGAPTNADGSLNLVHYTAWLVKEMAGAAGKTHGD